MLKEWMLKKRPCSCHRKVTSPAFPLAQRLSSTTSNQKSGKSGRPWQPPRRACAILGHFLLMPNWLKATTTKPGAAPRLVSYRACSKLVILGYFGPQSISMMMSVLMPLIVNGGDRYGLVLSQVRSWCCFSGPLFVPLAIVQTHLLFV